MTIVTVTTTLTLAYLDAYCEERQELAEDHKPLLKTPPHLPANKARRILNPKTVDTRWIPHLSTKIKGHARPHQRRMTTAK